MCGRYTYLFKWQQLHRLMRLTEWPQEELVPRYNVAPTQAAPVVRLNERGERIGDVLDWGFVPAWSKDPAKERRPINARGETLFTSPLFRAAARQRRCLVPVSGFYEWQQIEGQRPKIPQWIGREDREPLFFAGLWDRWSDPQHPDDEPLDTFTIVTTSPNPLMARLHNRMPVIVPPDDWQSWLDPSTATSALHDLIRPYPNDDLIAYPVSTRVNSPAHEDSTLIQRVEQPPESANLFG